MKKVLKIILITIVVLAAVFFIGALFIPKTYHVERSVTINSPREKVWSNVSSLHGLHSWSPWIEADPNVKITYEGQDGTVGAAYHWVGNSDVGEGIQTISKIEPQNTFGTHIHFIEPMDGESDANINLANEGTGTKVTWSLDGKDPYPMNVMVLFMDKFIGDQYSKGLNKLKTLCETN